MSRVRFLVVGVPVLTAGVLLWIGQSVLAGPGGHSGGHSSGGHSSGGHSSLSGARSSPGVTFRTTNGNVVHVNPNVNSFHNHGNVIVTSGFNPHFRSRFPFYSSSIYYSYYFPSYYYFAPTSDIAVVRTVETPGADQGEEPQLPPPDGKAHILILLPTDEAEVWFNGKKTVQTGKMRTFASPELKPGQEYSYEIKAKWKVGDKTVEETRTLYISTDAWRIVDFTRAPEEEIPVPKPADG
jgi:uncharacterized protein (TIGR03000 family)